MSVPGVANVSVWGLAEIGSSRSRSIRTVFGSRNVTLTPLIKSTGNALWVSALSFVEASTPGTGGFVETPKPAAGRSSTSNRSPKQDFG